MPSSDPDALEAQLRQTTWRFLRGLGCDPGPADDLVQEAFLRAAQRPQACPADHRARQSWLFTVARNLFLDLRRRQGRRVSVAWSQAVEESLIDCLAPEQESAQVERAQACAAQLAPRAARIVAMFYREDRSRADIAKALGMTEAGVKTALQRARAFLKTCIEASAPCQPANKTCTTPS